MNELLELILTPLEAGLADQVRQCFGATRHGPHADEWRAVQDALQDFPDGSPDAPGWWLDPAQCRWWLCLHVDWKAYDEVQWQVQAISRTLGLDTDFLSTEAAQWETYFERLDTLKASESQSKLFQSTVSGRPLSNRFRLGFRQFKEDMQRVPQQEPLAPPSDTPTMDVLGEASEWLQERGYELLYLSTGGDEYLAVPIRLDLLTQAQAAAERLNLSTYLV